MTISNLRIITVAQIQLKSRKTRNSKCDIKAVIGCLIGYNENEYYVILNNTLSATRHVDIIKENEKNIDLNFDDYDVENNENDEISDNESLENNFICIDENK